MAAKWEPPKLDLGADRYSAFKAWKQRWKDYTIVTKMNDESAEYKCSMLRYTFSDDTQKIYDTLALTDDEAKNSEIIINKLEIFAKGTVNETMERHTFNTRNQEDGEVFDDFQTEIKLLSKNCNFCDTCHDGLIRDRIVGGIRDPSLRQKLLPEVKLDLKKAEESCRAREKAREGSLLFDNSKAKPEKDEADVNELNRRSRFDNNNTRGGRRGGRRGGNHGDRQPQPKSSEIKCKFCTHYHKYGRFHCHANGKPCNACGQLGHFEGSEICKKNQTVRNVNDGDGEELREGNVDLLYFSEVVQVTDSEEESEEDPVTESEEESITTATEEPHADTENEEYFSAGEEPAAPDTYLMQVEEEQDEEYLSCSEEVQVEVKPKRKRRRRGPRKPKKTDDDAALLCPLAHKEDDDREDAISWEIHMPGVNGEIHFKIDTGADVTVIPEEDLCKMGMERKDILRTRKKLFGPGKQKLKCLGFVKTKFTWGEITDEQIVYENR